MTIMGVPSVDLTCMYFLQRKAASCSAEKSTVCVTHVKFKAGQGRMCHVICWGLQHFIGVLHNRKPGTYCPPGLKQQACPVLPPSLPCDTDGDMWPTIDKKKKGGGGVFEGRNACFWTPSISTPGQFCWGGCGTAVCLVVPNASYLTFIQCSRMLNIQQICIFNSPSRDISW